MLIGGQGNRGSEAITYERDDFWLSTFNKQLNFLQHSTSMLTINGRAVVVIPANVLWEADAAELIRRKLLDGRVRCAYPAADQGRSRWPQLQGCVVCL